MNAVCVGWFGDLMTEYATTPTNTQNPILNPRIYWKVSAWALAGASIGGFLVNIIAGNNAGIHNLLMFDWLHNALHAVLAAAAFFFGYANLSGTVLKRFAILFGLIYGGLGVVGLVLGQFNLLPGLHVELGENLIHVSLGAWALTTGLTAKY